MVTLREAAGFPRRLRLADARLLVLVDNEARPGFLSAWGLSIYVELGDLRILFDAGPDPYVLMHNAERLGVDLSRLDFAVLSHHHADHYGGLPYVAEVRPGLTIYVPPGPVARLRSIGLEPLVVEKPTEVAPRVFVAGPLRAGFSLWEQALLLNLDQPGPVLLVGCSHPGVSRFVELGQGVVGRRTHAVLGGFHFPGEHELRRVAELVDRVFPMHCSGDEAKAFLARSYPGKYGRAAAGDIIEF